MAKIYKDGMTLMRDTASLTNAIMENRRSEVKVGDTFARLMWTDRELWQVTEVVSPTKFKAMKVQTRCENEYKGTENPVYDEDGKMKLYEAREMLIVRKRKYWYAVEKDHEGNFARKIGRIHCTWGETTGYRDPSF